MQIYLYYMKRNELSDRIVSEKFIIVIITNTKLNIEITGDDRIQLRSRFEETAHHRNQLTIPEQWWTVFGTIGVYLIR